VTIGTACGKSGSAEGDERRLGALTKRCGARCRARPRAPRGRS
jgi:hypothetical protein